MTTSTNNRPRTSRGDTLRWATGTLLVALAVLVVVLLAGGGAPAPVPAGLPDPGPVTGWGLPTSRVLADLFGLATVGLLMAPGLLLPSSAKVLTRPGFGAAQLAVRTAVLWAVAVAVELVLTTSDITGLPLGQALDPAQLRSFATQVPQGRALLVQLVLTMVVAVVARSTLTSSRAALATALAVVAVAPPTLTGHSAASGNHELAVASLMVHVICASLWVGGLLALLWVAVVPSRSAEAGLDRDGLGLALARFSVLAGVCWVGVGVSGVVNAAVRLDGIGAFFSTSYGVLVLCKVAALVVLGGFGWWHRKHTVEQLRRDSRGTVPRFVRVAAVEVLVMAATVGLAVGLSRTPTPATSLGDTSRAADLLGFSLPPAPDAARLALGWLPDGFALTFLVVAAGLYAAGLHALHRRGDRWPVGRTLSWYAGLLVVAWATVGGLGVYSHVLFSAHMVAHMMLSMVAPIGLVLGAPVTLALRALPGRRVPKERGLRQLLQLVLQSRVVRVVSNPLVAAGLFVVSLYGLYFTSLFGVLMSNHLGHVLMELHFLVVGSLFFWVLVGIDPTPRRWHPFARIALVLVVISFHSFFAIALMNTQTVLARTYYAGLHRGYATNLLADQHLGAGISWALGEVPIVLVLAAVFVQWIRSDRREAERADRAAGRAGGDDELRRYNDYLAQLSEADTRER